MAKSRPPDATMTRGEYRLDHAVVNGANMVMKATASVPIRSISAGEAFVKGVSGW